jgi:hypothetical protein
MIQLECDLREREIDSRNLELGIGPKVGYVRSAEMRMLGDCDINSIDEQ